MKKVFLLFVAMACLATCNNQPKIQEVAVADFNGKASALLDQTITLKGTAKHICHTSFRKLFVGTEGTAEMITVMAGEGMDNFDVALEGKDVIVEGVVKVANTIDNAYLDEWEKELKESGEMEGEHTCVTEQQAEDAAVGQTAENAETDTIVPENPQFERIRAFRQKIEENGGNPLIFYNIVATSVKVVEWFLEKTQFASLHYFV